MLEVQKYVGALAVMLIDHCRTEKQIHIQNALPLNLIPIRIDVEIPSFRPEAPLPTPSNAREYGIDETLPAYKQPEPTPAFRLHDSFLWNLHEALLTPDQFAKKFVEELDFPYDRRFGLIQQISSQIRQQLEEYAGIAMHPLFHTVAPSVAPKAQPQADGTIDPQAQNSIPVTTAPSSERATPMPQAATILNHNTAIPLATGQEPIVTATASPGRLLRDQFPAGTHVANNSSYTDAIDILNPSEAYRCIVSLSISHLSSLYTDKFEWSLLHPPGHAEHFAAITSADLGLSGEWTSAIAHAIYEAVLRLKKEVCENGGALLAAGLAGGELPNESVPLGMGAAARQAGDVDDTEIFDIAAGVEAGFRWDPEALGIEWEPRVEELSKEDIEKREGDRERQLRRVRRETARFSSTTNTNTFTSGRGGIDSFRHDEPAEEERMGRGERSKKKRRFRSMSPGRDTPDAGHAQGGYGGGVALTDAERVSWRCSHCQVWGAAVWAVRDGPGGAKVCISFSLLPFLFFVSNSALHVCLFRVERID